jgi:hypothetical protein
VGDWFPGAVKRSARPVTDRQPEGSLGWVVGGREAATGIGQVFLSTRPLLTSHRSHPERIFGLGGADIGGGGVGHVVPLANR